MAKRRNRNRRGHRQPDKPAKPAKQVQTPDKADAPVREPDKPDTSVATSDAPVREPDKPAPTKRDRAKKAAGLPPARVHRPPPAREPTFWFGFEISWAKLAVARFVIFGLLAIDAFMQIRHAPRYGAGNFNVAQLPLLDAIAPGRAAYGAGQLLLAYLFTTAAFGVATRVIVPICAALYAWLYFVSQLDSYQHHYLVVVVLLIASFVPWQRPADAMPATPIRTWAIRLLLVQLAVMYGWAAISKMDMAWVDGRTLSSQLTGTVRSVIEKTIGFKVAAMMVILTELVLAATVWSRRAWVVAAPLGVVFHLGVLASGLEIGLFAYLMLGLYILIVPDRIWIAVAAAPLQLARRIADASSWIAPGIAIAVGLGLAQLLRIENAFGVALVACAVPIGVAVHAKLRQRKPSVVIALAHVAAIVLWLVADRASDVAIDYYRFWGGSQRRLGNLETARVAYEKYQAIAPDDATPHYQLGRVLLEQGKAEPGLAALHEAQRLEPARARAFIEEARWLVKQGKLAEALDRAKQGTFAEPSNSDAKALVDSLSAGSGRPPPPPPAPP